MAKFDNIKDELHKFYQNKKNKKRENDDLKRKPVSGRPVIVATKHIEG